MNYRTPTPERPYFSVGRAVYKAENWIEKMPGVIIHQQRTFIADAFSKYAAMMFVFELNGRDKPL